MYLTQSPCLALKRRQLAGTHFFPVKALLLRQQSMFWNASLEGIAYYVAFLYWLVTTLSQFLVGASPNIDSPNRLAKRDRPRENLPAYSFAASLHLHYLTVYALHLILYLRWG